MESVNRRTFIKGAGAVVAAGGVAAALPLGAAGASIAAPKEREEEEFSDRTLDEPVIAHLKDLRSGEFALYVGEREITVHDRKVASRLFAATREGK